MKNAFEHLQELSKYDHYDRSKEIADICDTLLFAPKTTSKKLFILQHPTLKDPVFSVIFYDQSTVLDPKVHVEMILPTTIRCIDPKNKCIYFCYFSSAVNNCLKLKYKILDVTVDSPKEFFLSNAIRDLFAQRIWKYYQDQINLFKYQLKTIFS